MYFYPQFPVLYANKVPLVSSPLEMHQNLFHRTNVKYSTWQSYISFSTVSIMYIHQQKSMPLVQFSNIIVLADVNFRFHFLSVWFWYNK